jgi:transcriptional antiterminator
LTAEKSQKINETLKIYRFEAEGYFSLNIYHLALHALIDVKRCLSRENTDMDSKIQVYVNELGWNKAKRHIPREP